MTYTTQQLQAMSDFEVNKALAKILPYTQVIGNGKYPSQSDDAVHVERRKTKYGNIDETGVDYCNNPNDIMPLAFELGVKLDCVACPAGSGFVYYAKSYDGELQSDYDSACRAIACLILMMED